jgi:hypothetical protein
MGAARRGLAWRSACLALAHALGAMTLTTDNPGAASTSGQQSR